MFLLALQTQRHISGIAKPIRIPQHDETFALTSEYDAAYMALELIGQKYSINFSPTADYVF